MGFELTVLGASGSHTGPGRLCSGYLLRTDTTAVLVDAGNGSTANLQRLVGLRDLDAVVVSHRHVDHCVDLIGCFYALRFDPDYDRRLPLYAAPEVHDALTNLLSSDTALEFDEIFDHTEVRGGGRETIGDLTFELFDSIHSVPTVSMRVTVDGQVFAYSGDSAGGDQLIACARDADVFLCEATWQGDAANYPDGIHLTAREAGEIATVAGARRLVLTHIAGALDRSVSQREASETFHGPVEVAEEMHVYPIR